MSEYIITCDDEVAMWVGNDVESMKEIVRCRDCKHYRFVDRSYVFHDERHNDSFCLRFVGGKLMEVEPDGFCAWGERNAD